MPARVRLKGAKQLRAALKEARATIGQATARALYAAGNAVMTDAKQRAPIDTGVLRASGYVTLPDPQSPRVEVGFGGAAAQYALIQHERTEFRHEVGEAKFLENAINSVDVRGIVEEELASGFEDPSEPQAGPHNQEPE